MKVLVGLSGGVDSAAAAYLLKKQGYDVVAATMSVWSDKFDFRNQLKSKGCFNSHEEDIEAARQVAAALDIPYHVFDCSEEYQKIVLENFKSEYLAGRTPNPCVICNSTIKFDALPKTALKNGLDFDKFATGHYCQTFYDTETARFNLKRGADKKRDQSYFLYRLSQKQLSEVLMPLGGFSKDEVREFAKLAGLKIFDKKDSQDFYSGEINDILQQAPKSGNFVTTDGKVLGKHEGIWNYTIGQRRGMGIAAEKPLYVLEIRSETNEVVVGFEEETGKKSLIADGLNWISINNITKPTEMTAKIRSVMEPVNVLVTPLDDNHVRVDFSEPQKAIAIGQSVVFYDKDIVIGGGFIKSSEK